MFIEFRGDDYELEISYRGKKDATVTVSKLNSADAPVRIAVPANEIDEANSNQSVISWLTSEHGSYPGGIYRSRDDFFLYRAREMKFAEIKARRIEQEEGGLPTSFGVVDSEPNSQRKISGGVQMAIVSLLDEITDGQLTLAMPDPDNSGSTIDIPISTALFPEGLDVTWRFADNTEKPMTSRDLIVMGVQVGRQVAKCQMMKNFFDAQVRGAETVEQVEAIDVSMDWLSYVPPVSQPSE